MATETPPAPGRPVASGSRVCGGRYLLVSRIAVGGFASVWLARDERLGREVAVKLMSDTLMGEHDWVQRFRREAQAAAGISHPHVIAVYDYGVDEGRPVLVMEYASGGTLADRLAKHGSVDVVALGRDLFDALGQIHQAGLVHRDIKPSNILFGADDRMRIGDFGIVRAEGATGLTQANLVIGTAQYLAPEVMAGAQADPRSDIYAAGVVLRQCLGGRPAGRLEAPLAAMTAADPHERPPSALAAWALLNTSVGGPAPTAGRRPATPVEPPTTRLARGRQTDATEARPRPARGTGHGRRPVAAALAGAGAALGVLALLTSGGGGATGAQRSGPPSAGPSAPLSSQLDALQARVSWAERRR